MQSDCTILDGKYEVVRVLGKGGMSTVYLCRNRRLGNLWAIKEIKKEKQNIVNLLAEPNILMNLNHTGIPKVIDVFYENENMYIVEDYIQGVTLKEYIKKKGRLDENQCLHISLKLMRIIKYLHSLKPAIIYRDLKPSNIMITPEGEVVLIDFGISREFKEGREEDTVYLGSKGYAAPEQYGHGQSGMHTDIYGLGAVMYFIALGHTPPSIVTEEAFEASEAKISTALKSIIIKCMEIAGHERYKDVGTLENSLMKILGGKEEEQELEYTKTLLLGSTKASLEIEKTILIQDKKTAALADYKKMKKKKRVTLYLLAALLVFVIVFAGSYTLWDSLGNTSKGAEKVEAASNAGEVEKPKADEPKVEIARKPEPEKDDINSTGTIYLKSPMALKDEEDEKGRGKKKDKKIEDNFKLFKLNPEAKEGKYNMKLIVRMEYIQLYGDFTTAYITVENNTGKNISVKYDSSTFMQNSKGSKVYADARLSDSMSSIPSSAGKRTFRVVFRTLDLAEGYMNFTSRLYIDDNTYDNSIKLNVKVVD